MNKKTNQKKSFLPYKFISTGSGFFVLIALFLFFNACRENNPEPIPFAKVTTFAGVNREFGEPFGLAVKDDVLYVSDGEQGENLARGKRREIRGRNR